MHKDPCGNCGSAEYRRWKTWNEGQEGKRIRYEQCDQCSSIKSEYPRDAAGQKVSLPTGFHKDFSYATGTPITSARQLAEVLKKKDLAQRG